MTTRLPRYENIAEIMSHAWEDIPVSDHTSHLSTLQKPHCYDRMKILMYMDNMLIELYMYVMSINKRVREEDKIIVAIMYEFNRQEYEEEP